MTIRFTLALLVIVAAALAYPWQTDTDWWVLGIAAAVLIIALAWWRGQFLTTMIARRLVVVGNRAKPRPRDPNQETVVVRVEDPAEVGLSLPLVAGYVERFGLRSEKVRVTTRTSGGVRTTWISLTIDAASNLVALRARSAELPLHETAAIAARRLADHLRETGLEAAVVDTADAPLAGAAKEMWRGVRDEQGVASAYGIPVDERLPERLAEVWAQENETWTAVEFSGTAAEPTVAVVAAVRTADAVRGVPVAGLVAHRGVQGPLLTGLDPNTTGRLAVSAKPLPAGLLARTTWPVGAGTQFSRT